MKAVFTNPFEVELLFRNLMTVYYLFGDEWQFVPYVVNLSALLALEMRVRPKITFVTKLVFFNGQALDDLPLLKKVKSVVDRCF